MSADKARIGIRLRAERKARGWDASEMARRLRQAAIGTGADITDHDNLVDYVKRWERGAVSVSERYRLLYSRAFNATEDDLFDHGRISAPIEVSSQDDEVEAIELIRRIEASDVGAATVGALESAAVRLCCAYPTTPPGELVGEIRRYRRYLADLLDGRVTLAQRRDLMVSAGWLSLLAACVYEDLGQRRAADMSRDLGTMLGHETDHSDLGVWAFEIRAWQALLDGDYADAVAHCRTGLEHATPGSSAAAQLTAQQARAWARMKQGNQTYRTLDRAATIVGRLPEPERPDNHFVFDPDKPASYVATTLGWLGDGSDEAEEYAREVIRTHEDGGRPRRVATARLDLALVLAARGEVEEAARLGRQAVASGRLVRSNLWRAAELDDALSVGAGAVPEVTTFHEQYEGTRLAIEQASDI